ncbi:hypothetical protein [Larkinella arboricola]
MDIKTLPQPFFHGLQRLLIACLVMTSLAASAQSDYYARTDSTKAYWKLQTDAASQKTLIRFFNHRHEPVYQETLSGRYVKLTPRNIRLFDQMLQRLVTNQLVSAQVKSHELVASSTNVPRQAVSTYWERPVSTSFILDYPEKPAGLSPLRSDVALSNIGRLKIHTLNIREEPILVTLQDDQGRYVYKEKTSLLNFNRTLNLTQLPEGRFRLEVDGSQKDHTYQLIIQDNPRSYQLRAIR